MNVNDEKTPASDPKEDGNQIIEPVEQQVAPQVKRKKLIKGLIVGSIVVALAVAASYFGFQLSRVSVYDAAVAEHSEASQELVEVQSRIIAANYNFVDGWNVAKDEFAADVRTVAEAPTGIVSKTSNEPVVEVASELDKWSESEFAPSPQQKETYKELAALVKAATPTEDKAPSQKNEAAAADLEEALGYHTPPVLIKTSDDVNVTSALAEKAETQRTEMIAAVAEAEEKFDRVEAQIDALDEAIVESAAVLVSPAEEALENQKAWSKAQSRGNAKVFESDAQALQAALDEFEAQTRLETETGDDSESEVDTPATEDGQEGAPEDLTEDAAEGALTPPDAEPESEPLVPATHSVETANLAESKALAAAFAKYISSGEKLKSDHDKATKAASAKTKS